VSLQGVAHARQHDERDALALVPEAERLGHGHEPRRSGASARSCPILALHERPQPLSLNRRGATCPAGPPPGVTLAPASPGPGAAPDDPGVVITDMQAGPTDKERCKRGGFKQHP
jgi:hypothetical protein